MTPVSGSDGIFDVVVIEGDTVYRSAGNSGSYEPYIYFQTSADIRSRTVYLEVTYKDIGIGALGVQYNSLTDNFELCTVGFMKYIQNMNRTQTAVFQLKDADFRNAQHMGCDLRLYGEGNIQLHIVSAFVYLEPTPTYLLFAGDFTAPYSGPRYAGDRLVNATTLNGKVICGYQGWFGAPNDPSGGGWVHFGANNFHSLFVDMWPDMLEYTEAEKYPVTGWTLTNGEDAYLFSSNNKKTILRHFQWMEAYGIDGVAIQRQFGRFVNNDVKESHRLIAYAAEAATRTGRTFYIMYCGSTFSGFVDPTADDWRYLIDSMKITENPLASAAGRRDRFRVENATRKTPVNQGGFLVFANRNPTEVLQSSFNWMPIDVRSFPFNQAILFPLVDTLRIDLRVSHFYTRAHSKHCLPPSRSMLQSIWFEPIPLFSQRSGFRKKFRFSLDSVCELGLHFLGKLLP